MAANSKIEWTDSSWTPIRARNLKGKVGWHCEHATTGCEFCYAEGMNKRLGTGFPFKPGHRKDVVIYLDEEMLLAPMRWKKPRTVFVCSMTDAFASFVEDDWLDKMFAVMALCPQHTFQVLTKRAGRMREYLVALIAQHAFPTSVAERVWAILNHSGDDRAETWNYPVWPLPNVWLGVSCERQQEADDRIPQLLQTPAAIRFVSCEPLLGAIDLRRVNGSIDALEGSATFPPLNWVITGGESGPYARPMHPEWAGDIRDHCQAAGVAYFHKQNGEYASVSEVEGQGAHHHFPDGATVRRVGKAKAGRLLRGQEWSEFPKIKHTHPASAPVPSEISPVPG